MVLRRRDDRLFSQAPDSDLRLRAVGSTVARVAARKQGANRRRQLNRNRVRKEQEELPQGRQGQRGAGKTRRATRSGVHPIGDGAVRQLSAMARQENSPDIPEAGRWQMCITTSTSSMRI